MANYKETEKELKRIQEEDEFVFRLAVSHLMDVGIRNLTAENVEAVCEEICKQDDSHSFFTNEIQCAIVRTAGKLAKIQHTYLLKYIGKFLKFDVV